MKKIIGIILIIVISLVIFTGCTNESNATTGYEFITVCNDGLCYVVYHQKTKVMYSLSRGNYNGGTLTLLVDAEGKPLLYEGEN